MSGAFRFPFRLAPDGSVAVAPYGSDQEVSDAMLAVLHTLAGERPMADNFGISDPVGLGIDEVEIQSDLATNMADLGFDDVAISRVDVVAVSDTVATASVYWERDEQDTGTGVDTEDDE